MSIVPARSERLGWHNRGYSDGFKGKDKAAPSGEPNRSTYLRAYRIGQRERHRKGARG